MGQLPEGAIPCTIDVVAIYLNISHEQGLVSLGRLLDAKMEEKLTTETLVELAENVLKNNIFQFNKKTLKQLKGTAIGTKFAPPYTILFMANLEERILEDIELHSRIWWRHINDIFLIWRYEKDPFKQFIETIKRRNRLFRCQCKTKK